jgi:hypothetical protein
MSERLKPNNLLPFLDKEQKEAIKKIEQYLGYPIKKPFNAVKSFDNEIADLLYRIVKTSEDRND